MRTETVTGRLRDEPDESLPDYTTEWGDIAPKGRACG